VPEKAFLRKFFEHDIKALVGLAGLLPEWTQRTASDPAFAANWAIVAQWSPEARYDSKVTMSAQVLIGAIAESKTGVLEWIKTYW
jgi:hypothetical protein